MTRRIAATVQGNVGINRFTDPLEELEVEDLRHRVPAVQVTNSSGKGVDAGRRYETKRTLWCTECFPDFIIVNCFGMKAGAAAKVVGLALYQCTGKGGVGNDFFGGRNNLFISGIVVGLRNIDVYEFEANVDAFLAASTDGLWSRLT